MSDLFSSELRLAALEEFLTRDGAYIARDAVNTEFPVWLFCEGTGTGFESLTSAADGLIMRQHKAAAAGEVAG